MRILVVDDDREARGALAEILREEGHGVLEAGDGREALDQMRSGSPDLVLLDLVMPVMSGWEFRAAQKQDPMLAGTPVVAITASTVPEARAVDVDLWLKKPLDRQTVLRAIEDVGVAHERNRERVKLAQAERLAALGTLAAGLAHEVNNPLTYVLLHLQKMQQLLGKGQPPTKEMQRLLEDAIEGVKRIEAVTREIRTFARADDIGRSPVNLAWVLDATLRLVAHEVRQRARLVKRYDRVPAVLANEGRVGQVFLNLIKNAIQAIPEGQARSHEIRITATATAAGDALVEIADTGAGIPEHRLSRIFEPFYSTKPIGQGAGLGLSICHGIVTSLGGSIAVESEVGRLTVFRVVLPAARGQIAREPRVARGTAPALDPARRRILVVDDEPQILVAVRRLLEHEQHEVVTASNGREALNLLEKDGAFDAILCDVQMPDLSGADLYHELRVSRPEVARRIIFTTGGAFTPRARDLLDSIDNPVLEKPLDTERLKRLLRGR